MQSITNPSHPVSFKARVYAAMTLQQAERFWSHVQICRHGDPCATCCWEWQGATTRGGYGTYAPRFFTTRTSFRAHRLAFLFTHGNVASQRFILHQCDNPPCCNPAHLWSGTPEENGRDMVTKGRAATGNRNGMRTHPERHAYRLHPEQIRKGERNGRAKLTNEQVSAIRALEGTRARGKLAAQSGVSPTMIRLIHRRKNWRHLPDLSSNTPREES